jgi:shikimate dehydrogenase
MLVYQGALAFELWTGVRAPVEVMFDAARARLREQST